MPPFFVIGSWKTGPIDAIISAVKTSGRAATVRLAAALLLIPATLFSVHWWHHDRQRRDVPVPAAGSTPVQVAEAYVAAADAHDHATLRAIGGGGFEGLTSIRLTEPVAPAQTDASGMARVGLNVHISGGDGSFPGSRFGWDLYLRRGGPAGWHIVAYGQG